jgi:hypothetical protein
MWSVMLLRRRLGAWYKRRWWQNERAFVGRQRGIGKNVAVCGELLILGKSVIRHTHPDGLRRQPTMRITSAFSSLEANIFERRSHPAGGISPG